MLLALALALVARAEDPAPEADGPEVWVGGGVSGGIQAFGDSGLQSADSTTTQAEVDGAIGWGWGHARVDLDLHFDPSLTTDDHVVAAYPSPWPEWAMVQLGREKYHVRLGIFNPDMGLEDWDPWVNYTPTYSTNFVYAGAGRFLGGEASLTTEGAVDLFAFGGYDVDWEAAGGGIGVATAQESWATWSGVFFYPEFACGADTCPYLGAALSLEVYPASILTVDLDTVSGLRGGDAFTSEQLLLNVAPEAIVNPFVRGELAIDPAGVLGAPDATASVGATSDVTDWLRVAAEGKALFFGGDPTFGGALVLSAHVPEPSPYSYEDPFGMD